MRQLLNRGYNKKHRSDVKNKHKIAQNYNKLHGTKPKGLGSKRENKS